MKTRLACLLVAFATLILPDLAYACGNGAVQFADDFKTPDAGWVHNDQVKIGSGRHHTDAGHEQGRNCI
jgi:hypothetical protein